MVIRQLKSLRTPGPGYMAMYSFVIFSNMNMCLKQTYSSRTLVLFDNFNSVVAGRGIVFVQISSYPISNLGQSGLFRPQHSRRLVVSSVVVQVVFILLDDNSEFALGACCLPSMNMLEPLVSLCT
jgi:hypothetical protein